LRFPGFPAKWSRRCVHNLNLVVPRTDFFSSLKYANGQEAIMKPQSTTCRRP